MSNWIISHGNTLDGSIGGSGGARMTQRAVLPGGARMMQRAVAPGGARVTWVVELGDAPAHSAAPYETHLTHGKC